MSLRAHIRMSVTISPVKTGVSRDSFDEALNNLNYAMWLNLRTIAQGKYHKVPEFIRSGTEIITKRTSARYTPSFEVGKSSHVGTVSLRLKPNKFGKIYAWQDLGTKPSKGRYVPAINKRRRRGGRKKAGGPVGEHPGIRARNITFGLTTLMQQLSPKQLYGFERIRFTGLITADTITNRRIASGIETTRKIDGKIETKIRPDFRLAGTLLKQELAQTVSRKAMREFAKIMRKHIEPGSLDFTP